MVGDNGLQAWRNILVGMARTPRAYKYMPDEIMPYYPYGPSSLQDNRYNEMRQEFYGAA